MVLSSQTPRGAMGRVTTSRRRGGGGPGKKPLFILAGLGFCLWFFFLRGGGDPDTGEQAETPVEDASGGADIAGGGAGETNTNGSQGMTRGGEPAPVAINRGADRREQKTSRSQRAAIGNDRSPTYLQGWTKRCNDQ